MSMKFAIYDSTLTNFILSAAGFISGHWL